jgi:hypothetical protein
LRGVADSSCQLDRHTQKSRLELKSLAKKGDVKSARILAKELVRANKQRDRLISSQARVKSVQMQLQHQLCEWFGKGHGYGGCTPPLGVGHCGLDIEMPMVRDPYLQPPFHIETVVWTKLLCGLSFTGPPADPCSHGQGHRRLSEVNRDHEDDQSAGQAASAQRDDARDEHGNDEGESGGEAHECDSSVSPSFAICRDVRSILR